MMQQAEGLRASQANNRHSTALSDHEDQTRYDGHSKAAQVMQSHRQYPILHLLGFPSEIRCKIWEIVLADMKQLKLPNWFRHPQDQFAALSLCCRYLYHDISHFRYRASIPWHRMRSFLGQDVNKTTIRRFTSLSIEIAHSADRAYFTGLAAFLFKARPYLRELRLSFCGSDLYGRPIHSHGCGNLDWVYTEQKLLIDGQRFDDLLPLWKMIVRMVRLELLVISNANLQLYEPMLLAQKPWLQYVHISTDPRMTAHRMHSSTALGNLLCPTHIYGNYPPVKVLEISANAMLHAGVSIAKIADTIEHLSWKAPDPSLASSGSLSQWGRRTAELIQTLSIKGHKLHTLRICMGGSGIYEHSDPYNDLGGALKRCIPSINSLKHFELHLKSKSWWLGKEMIARLSVHLENLYSTDYFINPSDLLHAIWNRFLAAAGPDKVVAINQDVFYFRRSPVKPRVKQSLLFSSRPERSWREILPQNESPWLINLQGSAYHDDDAQTKHCNVVERYRSKRVTEYRTGYPGDPSYIYAYQDSVMARRCIIGEDRWRRDFIPLLNGRLSFVHYEFNDTGELVEGTMTVTQLLLMINGRLLDRSRHMHLATLSAGSLIPPRYKNRSPQMNSRAIETAEFSRSLAYSVMLYKLSACDRETPRDIVALRAEIDSCPRLARQDDYFGSEEEAFWVFQQERAVTVDELPPVKSPVVTDATVDGRCHWMCPEACVTTLNEREHAQCGGEGLVGANHS